MTVLSARALKEIEGALLSHFPAPSDRLTRQGRTTRSIRLRLPDTGLLRDANVLQLAPIALVSHPPTDLGERHCCRPLGVTKTRL